MVEMMVARMIISAMFAIGRQISNKATLARATLLILEKVMKMVTLMTIAK